MQKKFQDLCDIVIPNIWIVRTPNNGRYPYCYSFLITGEQNILFDPNCDLETMTALREAIPIHKIIISHSHPDHMASAWIFDDVPILCPKESPEGISDYEFLAWRATGGGKDAEQWKEYMCSVMNFKPPVPTDFYNDGDVLIKEPSLRLKAIYTPGHSRDHYVFFEEKSEILFSSDIDFTPFGPWYGYEECSVPEFRNSIHRVRSLPIRMILSSHRGLIKKNIREEIDQYEETIEKQKDKIRDLLRSSDGESLDDLTNTAPFYKFHARDALYMKKIEAWMILHLLREMIGQGGVVEESAPDTESGNSEVRYRLHSS
ncbi:MAG: MBL fold metallo-hydrolase [bacterium]|nr:MBL fold metallo-hydrolase [bacterium]